MVCLSFKQITWYLPPFSTPDVQGVFCEREKVLCFNLSKVLRQKRKNAYGVTLLRTRILLQRIKVAPGFSEISYSLTMHSLRFSAGK